MRSDHCGHKSMIRPRGRRHRARASRCRVNGAAPELLLMGSISAGLLSAPLAKSSMAAAEPLA